MVIIRYVLKLVKLPPRQLIYSILIGAIIYIWIERRDIKLDNSELRSKLSNCEERSLTREKEYAMKTEKFLTDKIESLERKEKQLDSIISINQKIINRYGRKN